MIYLVIAAIIVYLLRTLFMFVGSQKIRKKNAQDKNEYFPFVSIIVPSRNEENNIEKCLSSLLASDYPKDKYEILAVNDRSEDSTLNIMQKIAYFNANIKIINLTEARTEKNLRGKPGAIHLAAQEAKGEILLMTDADCEVHPNWIKTVVKSYHNQNLGLQASFTLISGKRIFDIVQAIEWIYMHTMASAGVGNGIPLGCYGNNLSIRKSVYDSLGGYEGINFSVTEDLALEQAVHSKGLEINYLTNLDATVSTLPCNTFKEYISQKRRWAIGGTALGWKAVVFVLSSILMWLGVIASIIALNPLWVFALLFTRIAGDYALIYPAMKILKQEHLRGMILPSIVFFMLIELIIPFTLFSNKVVWKGQVFR